MHISRVDELTWDTVKNPRLPEAMRDGAKRAWAVRGQEGFYAHVGEMVPNFRAAPHSHPAGELIVVLQGSVTFDGMPETFGAGDVIVIPANAEYGFTAGQEGLRILNVRRADATVNLATKNRSTPSV